jgi:hypothetical protein
VRKVGRRERGWKEVRPEVLKQKEPFIYISTVRIFI